MSTLMVLPRPAPGGRCYYRNSPYMGAEALTRGLRCAEIDTMVPPSAYATFVLSLRRTPDGYVASVRYAVGGNPLDVDLLAGQQPLIQLDLLPMRAAWPDLVACGQPLTHQLFHNPILLSAYAQARAQSQAEDIPLRMRLDLDPADPPLHSLPWELLRDPIDDRAGFLAQHEGTLLSRLQPQATLRPLSRLGAANLRVLVAVAAPTDLKRFNLASIDAHAEAARATSSLGSRATVLASGVAGAQVTLAALLDALRAGYDLLYLVCHGALVDGAPQLCLENSDGKTAWVLGATLAQALSGIHRPLLAVLAACEGAGSAHIGDGQALAALGPQLVSAGVPSVIAMQGQVSTAALGELLPALLRELKRDGQIDRALAAARRLVAQAYTDWWRPALFLGVGDGQLWVDATPNESQLRLQARFQLRPPVGDFVGRAAEVAQIMTCLLTAAKGGAGAVICGLRGMGGIGKTELAYAAAEQLREDFLDAQLLIELGGAGSSPLPPETALRQIIHAFVPEAKLPDSLSELQAIYRTTLADRRVLILADDARDAAQVRPLLPPRGSALLITSRQRFSLPGMEALDLGLLPTTEAERLLLDICPRIGPQAAQLAARCGYLPLALRVAASLLETDATMPVARYLARLADIRQRLSQLRDPDDPVLDVAAALKLSYSALDVASQAALQQMSVFPSSFDLAAAQAVIELPVGAAVDLSLATLYRRSLVEYDSGLERYNQHDLVRSLCATRLDNADAAALRHASYYERVAAQADNVYLEGREQQMAGLALFDRERAHIDAGWAWALAHAGEAEGDALLMRLSDATVLIGELRYDQASERVPQFLAVLEAARRHNDRRVEGGALLNLGGAYFNLGETARTQTMVEQALPILREVGDRRGEGTALMNLGLTYINLGDTERAQACLERALPILREMSSRHGEGMALTNLGVAYLNLGKTAQAQDACERALPILQELGDRRGEGLALMQLGATYLNQGETTQAQVFFERALPLLQAIGDRRSESMALMNLGVAHLYLGQTARARAIFEQSLGILRSIGDRRTEGMVLMNLGVCYVNLGEAAPARDALEQALPILQSVSDRRSEGMAFTNLGMTYLYLDELTRAREACEWALSIFQEIGDRRGEGLALMHLGAAYVYLGELTQAETTLKQALLILQEIGDRRSEGLVLMSLGATYLSQREAARSQEVLEQALSRLRDTDDRHNEARARMNLGIAYLNGGNASEAKVAFEEALPILQEVGDRSAEAIISWNLGLTLADRGELARAIELLQRCVDYEQETGNPDAEADASYVAELRAQVGSGAPQEAR